MITGSLLPASSPVIRAVGRLPVNQKVLHFCGYTWLAILAFLTIKSRSLAVTAALAMILLGVALEFGQKLVPGRAFEVRDMFINGFGVLTGIRHRHPEPPSLACGQQQLTPPPAPSAPAIPCYFRGDSVSSPSPLETRATPSPAAALRRSASWVANGNPSRWANSRYAAS